jgi:L-alanine-DL-glutamate epimerase-like enolase superfamily enzyme
MARAAVDIALWDSKAQAAGVPLWHLLGGHTPGKVKSYNTDGGWLNFEIPRLIDEMSCLLELGYHGVRMKIGKDDPQDDIRRVSAVREALGPDVELMIDVNQRWDLARAVTWAPRFEQFRITWVTVPRYCLRVDRCLGVPAAP